MKGSKNRRVFPSLVFEPPPYQRDSRTPSCRDQVMVESFPILCVANPSDQKDLEDVPEKGSFLSDMIL